VPIIVGELIVAVGAVGYYGWLDFSGADIQKRATSRANALYPMARIAEQREAHNQFRHCVASCMASRQLGALGMWEWIYARIGKSMCPGSVHQRARRTDGNNALGVLAARDVGASSGPQMDAECQGRCLALMSLGLGT